MSLNESMLEKHIFGSISLEKDLNKSSTKEISDLEVRKSIGAFYTPIDVCYFVWSSVFRELFGSNEQEKIRKFISEYDIVEPSNGGGAFLLAYLKILSKNKLFDEWFYSNQMVYVNDINHAAINDFKNKMVEIGADRKFEFNCQDGRRFLKNIHTNLSPCIIGNPPYFKQKIGEGLNQHNDIYGDFVSLALRNCMANTGIVSFLVPLSITFSRSFLSLRNELINADAEKKFTNFDNMPDYVFKQGKRDSANSNKAISQRISLVTVNANKGNKVSSTKLISWKSNERSRLFSESKTYFEVSPIGKFNIIPKPSSSLQFKDWSKLTSLSEFIISQSVAHSCDLYFGTTARNFLSVGLDKFRVTGISNITIKDDQLRGAIFYYLCSESAWLQWRAIGDGFHVTKENLYNFRIPRLVIENIGYYAIKGEKLWQNRNNFKGSKLNSGKRNDFFNFIGSTDFCQVPTSINKGYDG